MLTAKRQFAPRYAGRILSALLKPTRCAENSEPGVADKIKANPEDKGVTVSPSGIVGEFARFRRRGAGV